MLLHQFKRSILEKKTIAVLFFGWLLTMPFGAKIGSFSLGFMTIYPNLIFTFLLTLYIIVTIPKWDKPAKYIAGFLLLWVVVAIINIPPTGFTSEALFDIRSLILQLLYCIVIFNVFYLLSKEKFTDILVTCLRIYLTVLILFGLFEFFTGNHFQGTTTDKFEDLMVSNFFYSPLFIYDNSNDFLTYSIFILMLLIVFDQSLRNKEYKINFILAVLFLFAQFADSKIGSLAILFLLVFHCAWKWLSKGYQFTIKKMLPYLITAAMLLIMLVVNPIFIGPKYHKTADYRMNEYKTVTIENGQYKISDLKHDLNKSEQTAFIHFLDSANRSNPASSFNIRKNLLLNGLEFIKEAPLLGIGPGAFRIRHIEDNVKYDDYTVTSAHNFPIEVISQFGILGWIYFGWIVWLLIQFFKRKIQLQKENNLWVFPFFIILPLLWMMPSSYLYLDIHWLLLPLLFCLKENLDFQKSNNG